MHLSTNIVIRAHAVPKTRTEVTVTGKQSKALASHFSSLDWLCVDRRRHRECQWLEP